MTNLTSPLAGIVMGILLPDLSRASRSSETGLKTNTTTSTWKDEFYTVQQHISGACRY